jgi:hypothetical protein
MRARFLLPLIALAAGLAAAVPGCLSPLEPDTPRLRFLLEDTLVTPPAQHHRIPCVITNIVATETGMSWACTIMDSTAEADTAAAAPAVWFRLTLQALPPFAMGQHYIASFTVRADSIPADGSLVTLGGDVLRQSGVVFYIGKAIDSSRLTIIDSVTMDPATLPLSSLSVTHQAAQRQFTGQYSAMLAAYRFSYDVSFILAY